MRREGVRHQDPRLRDLPAVRRTGKLPRAAHLLRRSRARRGRGQGPGRDPNGDRFAKGECSEGELF
jgi:hypothetical protein